MSPCGIAVLLFPANGDCRRIVPGTSRIGVGLQQPGQMGGVGGDHLRGLVHFRRPLFQVAGLISRSATRTVSLTWTPVFAKCSTSTAIIASVDEGSLPMA